MKCPAEIYAPSPRAYNGLPELGLLKTKPADLTTIAKKNNGVFPSAEIYEAIDGRNVTPLFDSAVI
jgi:hypothetical protein